MLNRLYAVWSLSLLLLLCRSTCAQTPSITFAGVTGGFQDGVPRVVGWEFTTGSQALLVEQLGVYDFQQDGLQTAHDVAIYSNQTHNAIVSATVSAGNSAPLSGFSGMNPSLLRSCKPTRSMSLQRHGARTAILLSGRRALALPAQTFKPFS